MENKNYFVYDLEKHQTKDIKDAHINGELTVIWRDWDKIIKNPEMVYLNTVNPGEIKGPHVHKNRTSYFFCIEGKIIIVVQNEDGKYDEIKTNSTESKLISVPNGVGAAIINPSKNISKILVLADISWKQNDNEMDNITFDNYNWEKWKNN